ncbi:MAG: RagB/SusD family nutrient uptake outer membrane protein [Mucilaginibacter sp.]|uniref:RagB/SusD family nutrient uptake outer membrane protein n=1 Tax=Mucilaginibacter sp. TaxID=1882438 RepID=UPI003267D446
MQLVAALCAISATFSSGCKKMIEIEAPHNSITSSVVYATDASAASAIAGLYATFNISSTTSSPVTPSLYGGMSSDELVGNMGIGSPFDYQFATNKLVKENPNVDANLWVPQYKTINYANSIIEGVAASTSTLLTDSARKQLVGEAKFMRAYSHLTLTGFFGDVPIVLTTDFNQTALLPRSAQSKVYQQVVTDLLDAQTLLRGDYNLTKNERVRANKWAATALLARTYLYQQNWKDAEAQATSIINNTSLYSSVIPLSDVFLKNSKEAIFQLIPSTVLSPYGIPDEASFTPTLAWSTLSTADQATFLIPSLYSIYSAIFTPAYVCRPELAAAFETGDQRKTVWTANIPSPASPPYNGVVTYYPHKYTQPLTPNLAQSAMTQYQMILRLGEQYLIRAEARARQNNLTGAAADINVIRARAGLLATTATSQTDMLAAVAQERRVELFSECGHRWFDLKRTGKATEVLSAITIKQPFDPNQLLYPIPARETTTDPNLGQNPGY